MRPSIDHTILSPSGRASKRARAAALAREAKRLFPPGYWDTPPPTDRERIVADAARLRRSAENLRALAERGMSRTKFTKAAERLDAEAAALELSYDDA